MALTWSRHTILVLSISLLVSFVFADLSDKRLCGDPTCKEPVSHGKTTLHYSSPEYGVLSFPNNADVLIYSKEAGSNKDLWGVKIGGKRGYAPKKFIREGKVLKRNLSYVVDVGESKVPLSAEDLEFQRVSQGAKEELPNPESDQITPGGDGVPSGADEVPSSGDQVPSGGEPEASQIVSEEQVEPVSGREETTAEGEEPARNDGKARTKEEGVLEGATVEDEIPQEGLVNLSPETAPEPVEEVPDTVNENAEETIINAPETGKGQNAGQSEASPVSDSGIDTELGDSSKVETITPTQPYEVVDGTTIYLYDDTTMFAPSEEPYSVSGGLPETSTASPVTTTVSPVTEPSPSFEDSAQSVTSGPYHEGTETLSDAMVLNKVSPQEPVQVSPTSAEDNSGWLSSLTTSVSSWLSKDGTEGNPEMKADAHESELDGNVSTGKGFEEGKSEEKEGEEKWSENGDRESVEVENEEEEVENEEVENEEVENEEVENEEVENEEGENEEEEEVEEDEAEEKEEEKEEEGLVPPQQMPEEEPVANDVDQDKLDSLLSPEDLEARYHAEPAVAQGGFLSPWFSSAEASETSTLPSIFESPSEEGEERSPKEATANEAEGQPDSDGKAQEESNQESTSEDSKSHEDAPDRETSEPSAQGGSDHVSRHPKEIYRYDAQVDTPVGDHDHTHSALNPTSHDPLHASYASYQPSKPDSEPEPELKASVIDSAQSNDPAVSTDVRVEEEDVPQEEVETGEEESFVVQAEQQFLGEGLALGLEASEIPKVQVSSGIVVFLGMCGLTIVAVYFTHLMLVKMSREGPLLAALNKKDHNYRLVQAENLALQEELRRTKQQLESVETRVQSSSGDVCDISVELEKVKEEYTAERSKLEDKITLLEQELEESTTNGLEMHKMLSELLSSQKDASAFQTSVDSLQTMLDSQREKVESLTSDLFMKTRLNEELQVELSSAKDRIGKLDYQVDQLTRSLEEVTESKAEAVRQLRQEEQKLEVLQEANLELSQQFGHKGSRVGELEAELENMRDTLVQLRETVETKESELMVAKECLKQLRLTSDDDQSAPDEEKLNALFDVIRVKAELKKVLESRKQLEDQLQDTEAAQHNLEDTMESIRKEVVQLRGQHDMAVEEKEEAQKKLQVLTDYFKEKEAQLTKELESQEGLRLGAEGSAAAIAARIETYQQEISSYKSKVESLRKELEEQENSYKSQLTAQEQKAHESWLQTRTAERKQEELRQENNQLRNRLALMQKEREDVQQQHSIIKPVPKRVDANGTLSSPGPAMNGPNEDSGPLPLPRELDSPPMPPHPLHPPPHHMLPHPMFPGGLPPPHQPGMPPLPPFLPGEPPFMGHLPPPPPSDRRPPPAGGMASPPFGRSTSPPYDYRRSPPAYERRSDRFSPSSDRSHVSDRRYTPPPYRRRPSPDHHPDPRMRSPGRRSDRIRSPDHHRSDRMRSPDRRSDRSRRSPDRRSPDRLDRRSPDRRSNRRSPDRRSNRSPDGYPRARSPGRRYYDESDYNHDDHRPRPHSGKGTKTSTPLGPNDR